MAEVDKTYTIRWYGPFVSVDDVLIFEKQHADQGFQLYLLHGYKKCAKTVENYYCGQTTRSVYKRLSDGTHRAMLEIPRMTAIWIETITNVEPTKEDINVVEKIITAQMRVVLGEKLLLNQTNMKFPTYNVYVINTWHDSKGERRQNYKKYSMPDIIPDLIGHEFFKGMYNLQYSKIFSAPKIKWIKTEFN